MRATIFDYALAECSIARAFARNLNYSEGIADSCR